MNPPRNQDGNTSHDRQKTNACKSQVEVQNESGRETLQPLDRELEDAQVKFDDAREGSAQASADFLLLMADPGHATPNSSQQPGNGASLPNNALNPVPAATHNDNSTLQESIPINFNSVFVSGSTADLLSSPEQNTNLSPFTENPNRIDISSSGKNETHPYCEPSYARNMLAGPATSTNA